MPDELTEVTINKTKVSTTAWGDVDKTALGKRLAELYASGDVTKAQIREVYAYVPADAFTKDADGNPLFKRSEAWGPHHELQGSTIVLNRNGVTAAGGALAGARSKPSLSSEAMNSAKRHIRRHYRQLEMAIPDSIKEALKLEPGQPFEELVKGSIDYAIYLVQTAFYQAFPRSYEDDWFHVYEVFADYLIVWHKDLPADEFYLVMFTKNGDTFVFTPRADWEIVELTYQPKTVSMAESNNNKNNRFNERIDFSLQLVEAADATSNPDGPWRIRGHGITADVVNGNRRRYRRHVLETAVKDVNDHLSESAGQGRLVITGEADHPNDKGNRTPLLTETIINWDKVWLDSQIVMIEGNLLGTQKGKDVRAQMLGGVKPDISQRGYGKSVFVEEDDGQVEEVTELHLTGYDLVVNGSDPLAGVLKVESQQPTQPTSIKEDKTVDPKTLAELKEKYPDLVAQIEAEQNEKRRKELELMLEARQKEDEEVERKAKEREAKLRKELGIDDDEDLVETLKKREDERKQLAEGDKEKNERLAKYEKDERERQVAVHIEEALKELKYPDDLKDILKTALETQQPETVEAVDALIEAKKVEYDAIMAKGVLAGKGQNTGNGVQTVGPVIETETGTPEYAEAAFQILERLQERDMAKQRDFRKAVTPNEIFTRRYLEAFDARFKTQLIQEHEAYKAYMEAEATTDLNLPYSVSRAVVMEAVPELVALSIFDFELIDTSPTLVYFEAYEGESGSAPDVTDESITSDADAWVALDYKRIRAGTVVVTNAAGTVTYTEFDDYVIDYANGRIMVLSTGSMADATTYLVDYTYDKVRAGENSAIQRGKGTLSYQTITAYADRLSSLITDEAITFSRTQLGWDAVARTISMIIREIREMIDSGCIELALSSAVIAANNGGTWNQTGGDAVDELVEKLGLAKAAVQADNYMPSYFLLSTTNAERLSNWDGFKRDGFPDAMLNRAGFVGQVKGLPVFQSNQMRDSHALTGHKELVQHRVLTSKPMTVKGPFQAYSSNSLVAGQEYYAEEYNATVSLITNKGGFVTIT